jgi:hypothetical protein
MAECILQGSVENVDSDIQKRLDGMSVPPHLLTFRHPFGDDFVDGRLGQSG